MYKILVGIYAFGGLIVVFCTAAYIWDLVKGRVNFQKRWFSEKIFALFTAMAIFAPVFWYASNFIGVVPDGTYQIIISVRNSSGDKTYYRPADITLYTDEDYEDSTYYSGSVEMDSSHVVITKTIFLDKIYWTDDRAQYSYFSDEKVRPETETEVESYSGDAYYVNIGRITPDVLGVTKKSIWEEMSFSVRVEPFLITICCLFNVFQYLHGKPDEKI